jgi:two-component system chemotaxis response regulator CheB
MAGRIVVVGGSLGGLRALGIVFGGLPASFALPVAAVLHRAKESDSGMASVLQRRIALPVTEVEDKMAIEPGKVFLAPSDYHLLVGRDQFSLSTDEPVSYARPSIDVLFDSAADSFGSGVVAVVLTGANSDGLRGATSIRNAGGRVVVQDPDEAESAVMPLAVLSEGIAEAVLPLSKISDFLSAL